MPKAAENIIEKAVIRCKKAQHMTKSYQDKKKIKLGREADKKLAAIFEWSQQPSEDFKELADELQVLVTMVANMKHAVLEPLFESVETIERRMKAYKKVVDDNIDSASEIQQRSSLAMSMSTANLNFVMNDNEEENNDNSASNNNTSNGRGNAQKSDNNAALANNGEGDNAHTKIPGNGTLKSPKATRHKTAAAKTKAKSNAAPINPGGKNNALSESSHQRRTSKLAMLTRMSSRNIAALLAEDDDDDSKTNNNNNDATVDNENVLEHLIHLPTKSTVAAVKQQKLFGKLDHFFELVQLADERNLIVDPNCKIANMKVKSHTKGLVEKDGRTFKKGYQQQDLRGKRVKTLADLYQAAEQAEPAFKTLIGQLVDHVNGLSMQDVLFAPLKRRGRASEKAQQEYIYRSPGPAEAWLFDIVRCGITCKTNKQMSDVNKWLKENIHIVDCQNRFVIPQFDGYRDVIYHISVPYKDELAHTCEIQVHHKEFKLHFGISTHLPFFRPYFAESAYREQEEVLKDLNILQKVGKVDKTLMDFLMSSEDADQVKLFGRLFFEQMEEFDKALDLLKRALVMEESSIGKGNIKTATTYLYIGQVLLRQAESDDAMLYLRECLDIMKQTLGEQHPQIATIHTYMGISYTQKGQYGMALKEHQVALQLREKLLGEDHLLVAESYSHIAGCLADKGEIKHALAEYRTALIIQETALGEKHEDVAPTHSKIGTMYLLQGDHEHAKLSYHTALSIREAVLGKTHPSVADSMVDIGDLEYDLRNFVKAEEYYRRSLHIRENILGGSDQHPDCARSMILIGRALCRQSKTDDGIAMIRKGVATMVTVLGKSNGPVSDAFEELGNAYEENKRYNQAMQCYKHVLGIRKEMHGRNHPSTAIILNRIATTRLNKSKASTKTLDSALAEYQKNLNILTRLVSDSHPLVADTHQFMGHVYTKKRNPTMALEQYSKALSIRNAVLGKYNPKTAESCNEIALLLMQKGDVAGAKMAYRQALAAAIHLHGEEHEDTATAHVNLGRTFDHDHEFDDAEREFQQAVSIRKTILGEDDICTAEAQYLLASVYNRQGNFQEALKVHTAALRTREKLLEPNHPDIKASKAGIEATRGQNYEDEIML